MVWIGRIRGDKFKRDFMIRSFALIQCSNKTVPNAPKPYDMEQNMSLGSHGVFLVHSQRKFPTRLRGMNFYINCTRLAHLHRVQCSNKTVPNAPKHYEMQQKMRLRSHGVYRVSSQRKVPTRLRGMNFCINCTSSAHFPPSLVQQRNDPKRTQNFTKCNKT